MSIAKVYNLHDATTGDYLCTYYDKFTAVKMKDRRIARGEHVFLETKYEDDWKREQYAKQVRARMEAEEEGHEPVPSDVDVLRDFVDSL